MTTTLPLDSVSSGFVRIPFPLPALLTLRTAGDMRRGKDPRRLFYQSAGIDPGAVFIAGQVHSKAVAVVPGVAEETQSGERITPDTDGLITTDRSVILGITVADCMPIFVYDPVVGARGLLHSGWRGTGILESAIEILRDDYGCKPRDILVTMGPCISAESYRVDSERAELFSRSWGAASAIQRDGEHFLDLRAANQEICRRNGVDKVNVIDHCTAREPQLGSFRREGPENYGLMLALLGDATQLGDM